MLVSRMSENSPANLFWLPLTRLVMFLSPSACFIGSSPFLLAPLPSKSLIPSGYHVRLFTADVFIEFELLRSIEEILIAEKEHAFHMEIELVVVWILPSCASLAVGSASMLRLCNIFSASRTGCSRFQDLMISACRLEATQPSGTGSESLYSVATLAEKKRRPPSQGSMKNLSTRNDPIYELGRGVLGVYELSRLVERYEPIRHIQQIELVRLVVEGVVSALLSVNWDEAARLLRLLSVDCPRSVTRSEGRSRKPDRCRRPADGLQVDLCKSCVSPSCAEIWSFCVWHVLETVHTESLSCKCQNVRPDCSQEYQGLLQRQRRPLLAPISRPARRWGPPIFSKTWWSRAPIMGIQVGMQIFYFLAEV
ncbi:hypothetical protein KCU83_g263, partial [Aureobasidium melanogenum]